MHQELSEHFATRFVGPMSPSSDYPAKVISKIKRLNGRAGAFHFFSQRRLKEIAKLVAQGIDDVDICFSTYIDVYHDRKNFNDGDLKRISDLEADWLSKATRVFFGTQWALARTVADYHWPDRISFGWELAEV